ncbi:MAG: glycine-rich protein [Bacilli bacterium]|nr:glycine-rich protein [Bacilli bacterium]MDD4809156.1 glycine-rich protein [Bacilli bacterium]
MKKDKGFTVVELIVSFTLISVIVLLLFQIIIVLKELYVSAGVKANLLTKQTLISEKVNSDLFEKRIVVASGCGETCIEFVFADGTVNRLETDRQNNTFSYGDYKTNLVAGSQFGNIKVSTNTTLSMPANTNNSVIRINIPIYHPLLSGENFGINVIYQYDDRTTSITDIAFEDLLDVNRQIHLIGSSEMLAFSGMPYDELGFFVLYDDGEVIQNDSKVIIEGVVGDEPGKTYEINYTIKDSNGEIMDQVLREVTVVSPTTEFVATGKEEILTTLVDGIYTIELWGAQGGRTSSTNLGGRGGYTVAEVQLNKNTNIHVFVGGEGRFINGSATPGGYNGGGIGGIGTNSSGASGGGASDIRLGGNNIIQRLLVAGGGGGAGSEDNPDKPSIGGAGGGISGLTSTYATSSYNGSGGTNLTAGKAATYNTNLTVLPTAGIFGTGGNGGTYSNTYGGGGGGGGYYGGGGGVRYGAGGGGSGYCGMVTNCNTYDGTTEFGRLGDGFIKITLKSITNN